MYLNSILRSSLTISFAHHFEIQGIKRRHIKQNNWHVFFFKLVKILKNDRICTLCNAGLIGDEFHYLLECTYFNDNRKNFLGENYCVRPNTMKYKNLKSTKNVPVLRNLCQFIKVIFSVACPP